jgi:hypothetical protein
VRSMEKAMDTRVASATELAARIQHAHGPELKSLLADLTSPSDHRSGRRLHRLGPVPSMEDATIKLTLVAEVVELGWFPWTSAVRDLRHAFPGRPPRGNRAARGDPGGRVRSLGAGAGRSCLDAFRLQMRVLNRARERQRCLLQTVFGFPPQTCRQARGSARRGLSTAGRIGPAPGHPGFLTRGLRRPTPAAFDGARL